MLPPPRFLIPPLVNFSEIGRATCSITPSNTHVVPVLELMLMFDQDIYQVTEGRDQLVVTVLLNMPVDDVIEDLLIVTDQGTAICK